MDLTGVKQQLSLFGSSPRQQRSPWLSWLWARKLHMSSQLFLQSMTVLISEKAASVNVWSLSRSESSHRLKTQEFLMRINASKHKTSVCLTRVEGRRRSLTLLQHAALNQAEHSINGILWKRLHSMHERSDETCHCNHWCQHKKIFLELDLDLDMDL